MDAACRGCFGGPPDGVTICRLLPHKEQPAKFETNLQLCKT